MCEAVVIGPCAANGPSTQTYAGGLFPYGEHPGFARRSNRLLTPQSADRFISGRAFGAPYRWPEQRPVGAIVVDHHTFGIGANPADIAVLLYDQPISIIAPAMALDSPSTYGDISGVKNWNSTDGGGFTIDFLLNKTIGNAPGGSLFWFRSSYYDGAALQIIHVANVQLQAVVRWSNGTLDSVIFPYPAGGLAWRRFAVTMHPAPGFGRSRVEIWQNGVLVASSAAAALPPGTFAMPPTHGWLGVNSLAVPSPAMAQLSDIRVWSLQRAAADLSPLDLWDGPLLNKDISSDLLAYFGDLDTPTNWISSSGFAGGSTIRFNQNPALTESGILFNDPIPIYSFAEQVNRDDGCQSGYCLCSDGGWNHIHFPPTTQCARAAKVFVSDILNPPERHSLARVWLAPRTEVDGLVKGLSYGVVNRDRVNKADCGYVYGLAGKSRRRGKYDLSGASDNQALRDLYEHVGSGAGESEVIILAREEEQTFYDCEGFRGYISQMSEIVQDANESWSCSLTVEEY